MVRIVWVWVHIVGTRAGPSYGAWSSAAVDSSNSAGRVPGDELVDLCYELLGHDDGGLRLILEGRLVLGDRLFFRLCLVMLERPPNPRFIPAIRKPRVVHLF